MQNIFRKDVQGKLPFLTDGRTFAIDTLSALLSGLESRLQPSLRALPGALNVAMLNNLRYVLVGIQVGSTNCPLAPSVLAFNCLHRDHGK